MDLPGGVLLYVVSLASSFRASSFLFSSARAIAHDAAQPEGCREDEAEQVTGDNEKKAERESHVYSRFTAPSSFGPTGAAARLGLNVILPLVVNEDKGNPTASNVPATRFE